MLFRPGPRRYCILVWLLVLGLSVAAPAQSPSFESTLHYSTLWRHTPKLTIRTGQVVWGQELGLRWQTQGRQAWHQWHRYPAFDLALAHFHLGALAHDRAWGLLPSLSVPILRRTGWLAVFRLGTGLGYITRPYDAFANPAQNAIGSHWNNFTQFRLGVEARLSAHWRLQAGFCLNHFSNGSSELPNFGINLPSGFATLHWSPKTIREADFARSPEPKRGGRRWGGIATGGLALVEYSIFDGPRYPVWTAAGAAFYHFNKVNRLLLGAEYESHRGVYYWGIRSGAFRQKDAARRGATRLALSLADEFLFGPLGVQVLAGIYLPGRQINQYVPSPWYSKLSLRYYFPPLMGTPLRLHTGISLKAHKTTAEYISLNAGLVF